MNFEHEHLTQRKPGARPDVIGSDGKEYFFEENMQCRCGTPWTAVMAEARKKRGIVTEEGEPPVDKPLVETA